MMCGINGEPAHVECECNARLYVADNYGDNHVTFRCELEPGHEGSHCQDILQNGGLISVLWEIDERDKRQLTLVDEDLI